MSQQSGGGKIQIIVAIIGVVGVIVAALITNWNSIFSGVPEETDPGGNGNEQTSNVATPNEKSEWERTAGAIRDGKKQVESFLNGMESKDWKALGSLCKTPFLFGETVIQNDYDVTQLWREGVEKWDSNVEFEMEISRTWQGEVAEYIESGWINSGQLAFFPDINIDNDDIVIFVSVVSSIPGKGAERSGYMFLFRRLEKSVEMAGFKEWPGPPQQH